MESTSNHLTMLAAKTESICPMLSRFYLARRRELDKRDEPKTKGLYRRCMYCFNRLDADNVSVKLLPKPKLSKKIKSVLKRYKKSDVLLGKFQRHVLHNFINCSNKMVMRCKLCGKKTALKGQTRGDNQAQRQLTYQKAALRTSEESIKVLTKKERRKEKKKLQKRRRMEGEKDEEKNAGLTIPCKVESTETKDQRPALSSREIDVPTETSKSLSASSAQLSPAQKASKEIKSQSETVDIQREKNYRDFKGDQHKHKHSDTIYKPSLSTNVHLSNISSLKSAVVAMETSPKSSGSKASVVAMEKLGRSSGSNSSFVAMETSGASKVTNKKSKMKMKGQQLSNLLKKEQNKQKEGSLADFLSDL